MAAVLNAYNAFVASHGDTFYRELVDLSPLIEKCNITTPIHLKLSSECTASDTSAVIILNVCKFAPNRKFPLYGLRSIQRILSKDADIEETRLQQMFLVHLSKTNMDVDTLATIISIRLDSMTAEIRMDENVQMWIDIATATTKHTHIGNTIDEMIQKTFGTHLAGRVRDTRKNGVEVSFISSEMKTLRGFSGYGTVYINQNHFAENYRGIQGSGDLVMIDIATVTIHEMAHVRIRQVMDNLNFSTPTMIVAANEDDAEFGRIVERRIFGLAIDWLTSTRNVPESFVKLFLKSIHEDKKLPDLPTDTVIYARPNPLRFYGGGVDMSMEGVI